MRHSLPANSAPMAAHPLAYDLRGGAPGGGGGGRGGERGEGRVRGVCTFTHTNPTWCAGGPAHMLLLAVLLAICTMTCFTVCFCCAMVPSMPTPCSSSSSGQRQQALVEG